MVAVIDLNSRTFLGHNQETYQDLRLALQLNLRRQLLIAVCDDSHLQAQLAQRLVDDLSPFSATGESRAEVRADQSPLVTLRLDANHPDLVRQVLLWLKQQRYLGGSAAIIPAFQILGVETLTRQSPTIQNRFLASLIRVDALLTQLDCRLLIWVPRPWLGKIQQAVPGFWRSRSGLFEFAGEPTPEDSPSPLTPGSPWPCQRTTESWAETDPLDLRSSQGKGRSEAEPDARPTDSPAPEIAVVQAQADLPPELTGEAAIGQLWQQIQTLKQQQAGPLTLAHAHLALAQLCRDRAEAGLLSAATLDFTLELYQRAIAGLAEGEADWCDALNDLASLYWLRSQQETHPEVISLWLHRSVETYQQALNGGARAPESTLARLYSNLAAVYSVLANYDDCRGHLDESVRAYHQALRHLGAEPAAADYANLQNSLGAVCWRLSQLDQPQVYLHQAITAYTEALRHQSAQANPQAYAMVQNNLGIAYWSLAQHERPLFLLEQAIAAYRAALAHRTLATAPAACAATHNNLGTAYWDLAQQLTSQPARRLTALQEAVAAYETALQAAERALSQADSTALGFDLWATFHSAGVVHDQLAQALPPDQRPARDRHLQAALNHYLMAYQGWQHDREQRQVLIEALVYTVRLNFEILGLAAQQAVLSKLPPELLAQVLPQL